MNGENGRNEKGQFTTGNGGGPGRKPNGYSLVKILRIQLQEQFPGSDHTVAQELIKRYIASALDGSDMIARRDIIDRIDGKPREHIKHSGDVTGRVIIVRHLSEEEGGEEEDVLQVAPFPEMAAIGT